MERVVQVNRDGGGVLIERLVLSNEVVAMMAGMQTEGRSFDNRDDEKLRANAASFGDSVRLVPARELVTDFGRGCEARYAFDDVNMLRVGQNIEDSMPGDPTASDGSASEKPKFTTFTLRRTSPARLVVHWPVDKAESASEGEVPVSESRNTDSTPEQDQLAMEMMKMAVRDMRVAMHVEMAGEIVETNAKHPAGRRVTLMDIDFGALLSDETSCRRWPATSPRRSPT